MKTIEEILEDLKQPLKLHYTQTWTDAQLPAMKIFYDADRKAVAEFLKVCFMCTAHLPRNGRFAITGLVHLTEPKFYEEDGSEIPPGDVDVDDDFNLEQELMQELSDCDWTLRLEASRLVFSWLRDDDNAEAWAAIDLTKPKET